MTNLPSLLRALSFRTPLCGGGALATRNLLLFFTLTALLFGTVSCKKSAGLSGAGPSSIGGSSGGTSSATNASGASTGTVFGGLSPINGATVSLYEAGTNTAIATTTTNAQGSFNLPFTGASGLLYLVATGGNPNGSGTNSNIQMIGLVGASSALPTSAVQVNELTTAGFMTVAKDFGLVNDSNGTVTFKAPNSSTAINNIVTQVNNLVSAGQLNTSNGNLTAVSQQTLSTVADAIANCVEGGSNGCSTLMSTATNPTTSGNSSNILDATNNMLNTTPASTISSIFSLAQTKAPTTGFALSGGAPGSLSAALAATVNTYSLTISPYSAAIDSSGNAWISNFSANTVSEVNSSGNLLGTFSVGTNPTGVAIDQAGNVWVNNYNGGGSSTTNELSSSGAPLGTFSVGSGAIGIAIDGAGNVWVANSASTNIIQLNSSGAKIQTISSITGAWTISIDASNNLWVTRSGINTLSQINTSGTILATYSDYQAYNNVSIDASGNIWIPTGNGTLQKLSSSGTMLGTFTVDSSGKTSGGTAIDGAGNVWVGTSNNSIEEFSPSGVLLGNYSVSYPRKGTLAIDASGNIWAFKTNTVSLMTGITAGPQFFPYSGPVFPFSSF